VARPELPYVAAAGISVVGATIKTGKLPRLGRPLIAVIVLILFASVTSNTKAAPLVAAIGTLLFMASAFATGRIIYKKAGKR
jgi:uncharacterized membrane protein YccC